MMGLDNPIHLIFLAVVLLLVFGAKRLPEMGHSLGTGLRGFKEAIGGESNQTSLTVPEPTQTPTVGVHAPATQASTAPLTSVKDDLSA
jgi:TatA/E family protein of Tat protein translocase